MKFVLHSDTGSDEKGVIDVILQIAEDARSWPPPERTDGAATFDADVTAMEHRWGRGRQASPDRKLSTGASRSS